MDFDDQPLGEDGGVLGGEPPGGLERFCLDDGHGGNVAAVGDGAGGAVGSAVELGAEEGELAEGELFGALGLVPAGSGAKQGHIIRFEVAGKVGQ